MTLYRVEFTYQDRNVEDYIHRFACGVYSTRDRAEAAIKVLGTKPGFCQYPNGFVIEEVEVDRIAWPNGFTSPDEGFVL